MRSACAGSSGRRRILYVERADSFGGSCVSLQRLVQGLGRASCEPIVLLPASHPAGDLFRARGTEVIEFWNQHRARTAGRSRDISAGLRLLHPAVSASYRASRQVWVLLRRDLVEAMRLARLMRERGIELVHQNDGLARNRASILAASWANIPQVCHVRAFEEISRIERTLAARVFRLIYISQAVERHCRALGIPAARGKVIYNAVDGEAFARGGDPRETRREFGWGERDQVVSNIGRITWWKGQSDFLLAFAEVVRAQPRTRALIVGDVESSYRDREYEAQLRKMVSALELRDHVVLTGFRRDVPTILAASDVVVHCPSQPEPFGLVVLEAMAAARPVVAVNAGGIPEMIEHGVTGLLVPPGAPQAVAQAVLTALRDPERARNLGRRAQHRVREAFSVERHVAAVEGLYAECLSSCSAASDPVSGSSP